MKKSNDFKWLRVLNNFISDQIISYENNRSHPLGSVLSEMCIDTWGQEKPADPAVWQDWKIVTEEIFNSKCASETRNSLVEPQPITKEQAFMASFNILDQVYWKDNHGITLGEVMREVNRCLGDIEKNESSAFWLEWVKYLQAERGKEYAFD